MEFIGKTVLPHIFKPRGGERAEVSRSYPDIGVAQASVTWIGHASFLIQTGGKNILVDPNWAMWLSVFKRVRHPGLTIESLPKIDLVLVTHAHYDHLNLRSLRAVADGQPIVVPEGVGSLVKRCGFGEVSEMRCWDRWESDCGGLEVVFTPAQHWGARLVHDTHRQFGGYVIRSGRGTSIYHAGDSAMFDGFADIGERFDIDVALLPIGAYSAPSGREVHMNPEEALAAYETLGAQWMVPMHYGTFPLGNEPINEPVQRLKRAAGNLGVSDRVLILPEGAPHVF